MKKLWYKKKSSLNGSGLFALSNEKKNDQVIQYIGDKVTKKEGDRRADIQIKKAEKKLPYIKSIDSRFICNCSFLRLRLAQKVNRVSLRKLESLGYFPAVTSLQNLFKAVTLSS